MADSLDSGNILTTQIGGNVVSIDPNKIVTADGKVRDRLVNQEDFVMYANLTAKIFPRSKLLVGAAAGDEIRVEIHDGELNFLKPKGKDSLDSDWTEAFTNPDVNKQIKTTNSEGVTTSRKIENQTDFQGFGITSISIKINSSYIPQVSINFTDVRGKTLFEQARVNTPYTAFFHLPYPTFFLTLKGYYGKAVQYQLTLEKFISRFDPSSGDYLVSCDFKGNHIAMLRDINMHEAVTAPYMYPTKQDPASGNIQMTKGRQVLGEVYREYYNKGLISDEIYNKKYTTVELIEIIQSIDNDMSQVFGSANLEATTDKLEYAETLKQFRESVLGKKGWVGKYLDTRKITTRNVLVDEPPFPAITVDGVIVTPATTGRTITTHAYPLKGMSGATQEPDPTKRAQKKKKITDDAKNALDAIVMKYKKLMTDNPTFNARSKKEGGKYAVPTRFSNPTKTFDIYENAIVKGNITGTQGITRQLPAALEPWFIFEGEQKSFGTIWQTTKRVFDGKAEELANDLSKKLNVRLEKAIGFKPTIRNVFAIILAGADTFLKLLDDVHTDAFAQRQNEQRLAVANVSDDSAKTTSQDNQIVYPWPQYYKIEETPKGDGCSITSSVLTYPGASDVIANTLAYNYKIWPEVAFVEEYTKATNYKFSTFNSPVANEGIDKDFTPISVYDWPPIDTPYDNPEDLNLWFELLDRAQAITIKGGLVTRYQATTNSEIGEAIVELAKYDALNLYKRIKDYESRKQVFLDLTGLGEMLRILESADYHRFWLYKVYGVVTPYSITQTYTINFKPNRFTVRAQEFEINSSALKLGKTNGLYDLAPTIFGPWVRKNFANGDGIKTATNPTTGKLSQNDFYDISKSMHYDINEKNVLTDIWTTTYLTKGKYISSNFVDADQELVIERKNNADALNSVGTVDETYESYAQNKFITEGEIISSPLSTTISTSGTSIGTHTTEAPLRLTSMLNTPYFMNALLIGVDADKNNSTANPYTQAAYLFLNSLPLPTFREKVLGKDADGNEEFGNYISQMFNQMPAIHNIPVALILRLGAVWWRYKREVVTQVDPLSSIWGDIGFAAPLGYTGPANIYDELSNSLNTPNYYNVVLNGIQYSYTTQQPAANIMQVGVYPVLIDITNYLATGSDNYTNLGGGMVLNDLIGGPGVAPLNIEPNSEINYTAHDGTQVEFYSVYMNSANITNPSVGVTSLNEPSPPNYYILYPSSGGLNQTDASTYDAPTYGNTALHNGASRILWGASNYGYFEHNASYQSTASQYFKKVDITKNEQEAWHFKDDTDYSHIDVLRGVFNTEQLDAFETHFLTFCSPLGDSDLGGSFKQIVKELVVVEKDWLNLVAPLVTPNDVNAKILAEAQLMKFNTSMFHFLNKKVEYTHRTTTNLDLVLGNETLLQRLNIIHDINNNNADALGDNMNEFFGTYTSGQAIPIAGSSIGFPLNPIEYQAMRIEVGEYYSQDDPQFSLLTPENLANPLYNFFTTINLITPDGIRFSVSNIRDFAPFIRLYGSYVALNGPPPNGAAGFLNIFMADINRLQGPQETYINILLAEVKKLVTKNLEEDDQNINVVTDDRPEVKSDDLKLELYNQFKIINDRWVSGTNLTDQTLFEKFLFLDRANQDIGEEAIINIWDILKLDSPFEATSTKTLTQSVASYLSIILANNYFNFIPLPSYINFFNMEQKGTDTQAQGNAMFGTFKTVDYVDSSPAFLCQYVGKPSSQLDVKTPNNGYQGDSFNYNSPNSPLVTEPCGNKTLSNKVMGFNVDFGIPNQNIFESVTLDQSQFTNTSEAFTILQSMADSGGGGATSPASVSLFNVYAARSYTAKITCVGNVMIQPTQYFQLRYLPMFNGPYLIINVDHDIRPNTIETTFEGVRVPRPVLPAIKDLVQRVNRKLYEKAEERLGELPLDLYYDPLSASEGQKRNKDFQNKYIASATTYQSAEIVADNLTWENVTFSAGTFVVTPNEDPEKMHLGVDICPTTDNIEQASDENGGILIFPTIYGKVTKVVDGCRPLQKDGDCAKYGNHVEIRTNLNINPDLDETAYYLTRYAFLREGVLVNINDNISRGEVGPGNANKVLGKMGNSGLSKDLHLHFEILRGVMKQDKIVEHYLNPANFLPRTR